ncbi:IS5 family transposase [Novacetimonas hansenii]|uniref:IS5 family transposase n=1 Tax=Novacetimonas hansenii TaxID=436 RepID=UPI0039E85939
MDRFILTDAQWAKMEPLCLGKKTDRGRSGKDNRLFIEAVLWIARTGSPWRDLPTYFGHWNSVYSRYSDWTKAGVFQKIFEAVSDDADMEYAMIDGTVVRVHRHGQGAKGGPQSQAIGRSVTGWSTKIIAMTDALGNLVRFTLIPGQHYDTVGVAPLLEPADFKALLADRAFDAHWIVDALHAQGACVVIPQRKNRLDRRTFDAALFKARHLIENFFCKLKEFKRIAMRSEKTDKSFAAMIYLTAAIINSR